ncbi:enoyl-CoA hydratase/isomerase family protein [Microbacterium sp.]|uniref:enoyl-CoA hydratase/isomerase family protein n=1 Tax=Microbacterium sp. TaxID=51671 RepID=UPI0037C9CCEB
MTTDSTEPVRTRTEGSTLVVTLDRPHRANALTEPMMRELRELWARVAADRMLRSVVITGAGKAFCAGADVAMLAEPRSDVGATAAEELSFLPGPHLGIPVIAAVNGVCAGGGLHFVADADICIAAEAARFVDPHVTVGQVSGLEPIELMLRMRRDRAVRMALLGSSEVLDAQTALAAGLVSEVVADEDLLPAALELGARIAAGSPEAIRATREVIRTFEADLLRRHLDAGWRRVQEHWSHPDAAEGPQAFAERRPPSWTPLGQ